MKKEVAFFLPIEELVAFTPKQIVFDLDKAYLEEIIGA